MAYAFFPDKTVGALRTSFWYSELPTAHNCNTTVLTANSRAKGNGVIVIPDTGRMSRWNPVKDSGLGWKKDVLDYLKVNTLRSPDVVIISGSPFMHFSLTTDFKKMFGCKVILDYRDPFANNANFQISAFKIGVKRIFEKRFNRAADGLITVNAFCGKRITGFEKKPHALIQNGFDDRFSPKLKPVDLLHPKLVYTGKFYFDPAEILDAARKANVKIAYAGPDKIDDRFHGIVEYYGMVDYPNAVQLVGNSDIGIIQTVGDDSISTTKIFDYIRCQRVVLVVSRDRLNGKGIQNELKDYPNVFWVSNESEEIVKALNSIQNHSYEMVEQSVIDRFSRRSQMVKLVDFIQQLLKG